MKSEKIKYGYFIISLDFEMFWGMRDNKTINSYGNNILEVHNIFPKLLNLFQQYKINATFATVGFLFAENNKELVHYFPKLKPNYDDKNLSPYNYYFSKIKNNKNNDKYHYAFNSIKLLLKKNNHEIASHTFSHYYCLESGQNLEDFKADMNAAIAIGEDKNITLKSLVFPRNQFNKEYLSICKDLGITSYRGNEKSWFYKASMNKEESFIKRFFRIADSYINLSGHNTFSISNIPKELPYNLPSSRFLRPFNSKLKTIEKYRLNRIKKSMTYAAKHNEIFHLWWHPHNFGDNKKENFQFLTNILKHYGILNSKYNFKSETMTNIANQIKDNG